MKVTTKITWGSGLLIALLMAALFYNLSLIRGLASVNQNLSEIELHATRITLEQSRLLDQLDEYTRKLFATADQAYAQRLEELRSAFEVKLDTLSALELSPEARIETTRLEEIWKEIPLSALVGQALAAGEDALNDEALSAFRNRSDALRQQAERISTATRQAVTTQVDRSIDASQQAQFISGLIAVLALAISLPILWWTLRSIKEPLSLLTAGTRSVAEGEFSHLLDTSSDDEFAGLAASFNDMVNRLREADRVKADFLSHVSHELKTPLVAIQETNQLLRDEIPGALNEKQKRLLDLNLDGGKRLSSMISKLLDLARMESQKSDYDFRQHDLLELVDIVVAGFDALARERGILLDTEHRSVSLNVSCDRDRVIQVLQNLLENATKFAPAKSEILIRTSRVTHGPNGQASAKIEVFDSGPGIPEDEMERIFDRFHQIPSTDRPGSTGVGLGLTICREIAAAHRGSVTVANRTPRGSVFTFSIPMAGDNKQDMTGNAARGSRVSAGARP